MNTKVEVYIWGHSLDESDKEYIEKIFSVLNNGILNQNTLTIFYHSESARESQLCNLFKILGRTIVVKAQKENKLLFREISSKNILNMIKPDMTESYSKGIRII